MTKIKILGKDVIDKYMQTLELLQHNVDNIIKTNTTLERSL